MLLVASWIFFSNPVLFLSFYTASVLLDGECFFRGQCYVWLFVMIYGEKQGNSSEHPKAFHKSYHGGSILHGGSATALQQSFNKH